jgi:thymidylate synthase
LQNTTQREARELASRAAFFDTPNEMYADACERMMKYGIEYAPRGRRTRELHPYFSVIANPRQRILSCFGRVINLPFALAEAIQIIAGINDPQALKYYNSQIIKIQGDIPEGGTENDVLRFNAAYGERVRRFNVGANTNVDQIIHVIGTLKNDPDSRQASIVISHPFWDNYKVNTKDRACNVYAHAMIRDGKLDWMQIIRSNDIVWGLPYNFIQWTILQEYIATELGIPMGVLTLVQDSLHVYEEFYKDVENIEFFNMYDTFTHEECFPMRSSLKDIIYWEKVVRTSGTSIPLFRDKEHDFWTEVIAVFNAYGRFKRGDDAGVFNVLPYTFELRWPLLRWFCNVRWNKDERYGNLVSYVLRDLVIYGMKPADAQKWVAG